MRNIPFMLESRINGMMSEASEETKAALQEVLDYSKELPIIGLFWSDQDVLGLSLDREEELTQKEIERVLERLQAKYNNGMQLHQIELLIDEVIHERDS